MGAIIVFAMLRTWGDLPKNQIDDQLITEAISEAITAHEQDPTAHLGAGESIDMHRTNEILDHPAQSIVPDKLSPVNPTYQTNFENTASWQILGTWTSQLLYLSCLNRGNVSGNRYIFNENFEFLADTVNDLSLDNIWQTMFRYSQNYHVADYYFGLGQADSEEPSPVSATFKIVNGVLYTGFGNDVDITYEEYGAIPDTNWHTLRVQTSKEFQEIYWIFDGVIIRTESLSTLGAFYTGTWGVYSKKVGGTLSTQTSQLSFKYVYFANEIS